MHNLASVVIGNTVIAPGVILIAVTAVVLLLAGRRGRHDIMWVIIGVILGVLLAAAFPVIIADINKLWGGI